MTYGESWRPSCTVCSIPDHPRTLQELADDYGISRERVRQLEKGALEKIRLSLQPANGSFAAGN